MSWGFRLFRVPLQIGASFLIVIVLLGAGRGSDPVLLATWVAVAFVSVVLHELGHAFVGRAFGLTPAIELGALGGLTHFPGGRKLTDGRSILVSLAGPAVSLSIGALVIGACALTPLPPSRILGTVVADLVHVNLVWGIFNLFPILPLDGGNALRSSLSLMRVRKAELVARVVSLVVIAAVIALNVAFRWSLWNLLLVVGLAFANVRALRLLLAARDPGTPVAVESSSPLRALYLRAKLFYLRRGRRGTRIDLGDIGSPKKPKSK